MQKLLQTTKEVKTFEDVFNSDSKPLAVIKKEQGIESVKDIIIIELAKCVTFFHVTEQMSTPQIEETVSLIIEEYYYFKPEDFVLCFNNAKKGKYGNVFNRIDGAVIFEWLNKYQAERSEAAQVNVKTVPEPREGNIKSFADLKEKLYGPAKEKAEAERRKEILIKSNREAWEKEAVHEWELSRADYIHATGKDEIYYAQYFPKGDYIKYYITNKIKQL